MRKFAVVAMSVLAFACGSSSENNNNEGGAKKPAQTDTCEEDATKCNGNTLLTCKDAAWTSKDCGSFVCGEAPGVVGIYACNPPPAQNTPKQEFEQCAPGSDTCADGLTCRADIGACVKQCNPANDTCGENRLCQQASESDPSDGICLNRTAQRDEPCLANGNMCAEGQGECIQVGQQDLACKIGCGSTEIGTQGSCPSSEQCVAAPGFVDPQDPQTTCTNPGSDAECNASEGYTCFALSGGQNLCARRIGWCGIMVPMLGAFDQAAVEAHVQAGNICDMTSDHLGCGVSGATGTPANVECVEVGQDPTGQSVSVCVGSCDGPDGNDLDCGTGYVCQRPDPGNAFYYDVQRNGDQPVTCAQGDSSACDTSAEYTCNGPFQGNTFYCSRPAKVCMNASAQ